MSNKLQAMCFHSQGDKSTGSQLILRLIMYQLLKQDKHTHIHGEQQGVQTHHRFPFG